MLWKIFYKERALKDLQKMPEAWKQKLLIAIENLQTDPFQGKKLQGQLSGIYSLRIWPYRILYEVYKKEIIIVVLHIGHRQGIYKN